MERPHHGYTLPPGISREEGSNGTADPAPMPADRIKIGWQGETKETLLGKADMLPSVVRALPRAYLVPPRVHIKQRSR